MNDEEALNTLILWIGVGLVDIVNHFDIASSPYAHTQ